MNRFLRWLIHPTPTPMTILAWPIPPELTDRIRAAADENNQITGDYIRTAVINELEQNR